MLGGHCHKCTKYIICQAYNQDFTIKGWESVAFQLPKANVIEGYIGNLYLVIYFSGL